jgi:hypothetical protein
LFQQPPADGERVASSGLLPALEAARQSQLDTALHGRVSAAGGKLIETQDVKTANLAKGAFADGGSDEVVLAHVLLVTEEYRLLALDPLTCNFCGAGSCRTPRPM